MESKSIPGSVCVNCYKLHAALSEGLKSFIKDSMLIYCTGSRLALGLLIQAFNEDEQRRKLHKLLTSCCLFSSLCWLVSWEQRTREQRLSAVLMLLI